MVWCVGEAALPHPPLPSLCVSFPVLDVFPRLQLFLHAFFDFVAELFVHSHTRALERLFLFSSSFFFLSFVDLMINKYIVHVVTASCDPQSISAHLARPSVCVIPSLFPLTSVRVIPSLFPLTGSSNAPSSIPSLLTTVRKPTQPLSCLSPNFLLECVSLSLSFFLSFFLFIFYW